MKILLTGGSGFLGKHITDYLTSKNHELILTIRNSTNLSEKALKSTKQINIEQESVDNIFKNHNFDCIIHAATTYGFNSDSIQDIYNTNFLFPYELLVKNTKYGHAKFFNFDTFFNQANITYEYLKSYAISKKHFQEVGQLFSQENQVSFINLKLFHLYGIGDKPNKFIPAIIEKLKRNEPIPLTSCEQTRDLIYISDVLAALDVLINHNFTDGYFNFDVGTAKLHSIKEVVNLLKSLSNSRSELHFGQLPQRPGEPTGLFAKNDNLIELGWTPKVHLTNGLKNIIENR